ncbi:hypothetical protein GP486_005564 [Trichoglossum hirsutum]|uniref:NB-ARC domain-containing protein n=1 Tax=Trichoglossum hirsutum TaxID=265104 RepID=A0A9P8RME6_9PEZI|nr:hypothetical protein GP486_005564 [Trichoglossum hirsutum]
MTFGYNADAAFGNSAADILDHVKDLLSSLIDKREGADEIRRPIVFISHSLGGIVVKQVSCDPLEFVGRSRDAMQALVWADGEPRYRTINEHTTGIFFFGTPHRGSEKAAYGRVLVNVATSVMRRPTSRLISVLQMNSDQLARLTLQFGSQSPRYQVVSFYECKPMKIFSSLVVEKHSALLGLDGEDQIPVDADHRAMCRFESRNDEVYEKLFKRIRRMLKPHTEGQSGAYQPFNKHYLVTGNVSPVFTGRGDVMKLLEENCLPQRTPDISKEQKRCVLYGLGGAGKTQTCLKFAQDYREKFWGIFWVDASGSETAERSFLEVARACGIEEDFLVVKRYLSNIAFPWLLIIDNADDPSVDISKYFPVGGRGVILVTTRYHGHKLHSTISSEFGEMQHEEAISLLLRCIGEGDVSNETSRALAAPVVRLLGCLALAIIQAGAFIRQKLCSLEGYCDLYSRRRKRLLGSRPVQGSEDYNYTVYTTWEVSLDTIRKMSNETSEDALASSEVAKNAIELLGCFTFFHYENIPEIIFEEAWKEMQTGEHSESLMSQQLRVLCHSDSREWDPYPIRGAVMLLSSFSLINTEGAMNNIAMHPLVHTWARDRLQETEQEKWWLVSALMLVMCASSRSKSNHRLWRTLLPHVDSCYRSDRLPKSCDKEEIVTVFNGFALVYYYCGRHSESSRLYESVIEARRRNLGDEHPDTLTSMDNLASGYGALGRVQDAVELHERALEARKRTLGDEHPDTLISMNNLAIDYRTLGQRYDALRLFEQVVRASRRVLGEEHPDTLRRVKNLEFYSAGYHSGPTPPNESVPQPQHQFIASTGSSSTSKNLWKPRNWFKRPSEE